VEDVRGAAPAAASRARSWGGIVRRLRPLRKKAP
jgi:hypothetical protein